MTTSPTTARFPRLSSHADLPFVNIELDGDVIRYGFFKDEEAAAASDPDSAGDFGETEAYAAGQEALGDDFEYIGAVDLAPILDEFVGGAGIDDVLSGASTEELIGRFPRQQARRRRIRRPLRGRRCDPALRPAAWPSDRAAPAST